MATRTTRVSPANHAVPAAVCPACGRRIAVSWPARSLLCGCGAQVLPRPATAPEPGFLRHGTGSVGPGPLETWRRKPQP
jgi:hypothetical protein